MQKANPNQLGSKRALNRGWNETLKTVMFLLCIQYSDNMDKTKQLSEIAKYFNNCFEYMQDQS